MFYNSHPIKVIDIIIETDNNSRVIRVSQCTELNMPKTFISLPCIPILGEMLKRILCKHNIDTCFQSVRPLGSFLNSGKDLTWGDLVSGVYKILCPWGKFYIRRTSPTIYWNIYWASNLIEKTLQLRKPPETFVSALAEHTFFHPEHFYSIWCRHSYF